MGSLQPDHHRLRPRFGSGEGFVGGSEFRFRLLPECDIPLHYRIAADIAALPIAACQSHQVPVLLPVNPLRDFKFLVLVPPLQTLDSIIQQFRICP